MIPHRVAALLLAIATSALPARAAEVTVKVLHVEQNPQASGFWQDIARKYMAEHPGVKIELQYLENEAYKKKLADKVEQAANRLRSQTQAG